jgi:uncharacterized protein (DUF1800 family)
MPFPRFAPRSLALLLGLTLVLAGPELRAQRTAAAIPADHDDAVLLHVLDRLTFGPRPGDLERLRTLGIAAFLEQQLTPAGIDDRAVEDRLAGLATLSLSSREIARDYVMPAIAARRQQQQRIAAPAGPEGTPQPMRPAVQTPPTGQRLVLVELSEQKVLRALYSERQLQEVLTDFWFNHFNVFFAKGATGIYVTEYERDAIRPHVLGRFRDLLGATAKSPAMLFYLDNWQNTAPGDPPTTASRRRAAPGRLPQRSRGINENYARELMELHTLGVDGGYTQQDVQEVARAFTGWTLTLPRQGGAFRFEPRLHDAGAKTVLGHPLPAGGGQADGERVLDILARHPATARFIATRLARRFVADDPPASLVDRVARRFTETDGDLREVIRAIVTSPEFFAAAARRAKVKSPFEFVVSAARAVDAQPTTVRPLVAALRELGMPLYLCQPPTGYGDRADAWVNTGALLNRMNVAVALTGSGRMGGIRPARARTVDVTPERLMRDVFAGQLAEATTATVAKADTPAQAVALLLGSPDFQRR